ncbi:MAG: hypothetical protein Q9216_000061 [Gyalolechia sp. 2 TL-2023]
MGAVPEGLSAEQKDAFVVGLRQIIQEIRGKKVKDFKTVASEIAAYRTASVQSLNAHGMCTPSTGKPRMRVCNFTFSFSICPSWNLVPLALCDAYHGLTLHGSSV